MTGWLVSLTSIKILLLAVPCLSVHIEPEEGSLAGGTWITVIFDGLEPGLLYPANGSQLEIHLVNVAVPMLPIIPCDISPVLLDLPVVMCRTRSLLSEAHEGLYYLEVQAGGQVVGSPSSGPRDSCTFKFSRAQTPIVYQVNPPSGVPGNLIHVYGWIITGRSETFDFDAEYIHSPLMLEAQGDKWVTPCSLVNRQTGCRYPIQEDHGLGTLQCRVEGNYIGSQNVSFSVFNKGKSIVHKDAWLVSAKQDLFLYQTYSEILSVFPETGSLGGRTDITITGDFFDNPAQVTVAGILCDIRHVSPRRIECTTGAPGKGARLSAPQAGNRGLLFEVGDAAEGLDLTEATPGYRWQIVPNASSPFGFWSKEGQPFRARLSGFFVAPETNNYTFWIHADNQASLYFSQSEDPRTKVKVASITVGTADWFDSWEQNGSEETWQQKTPKLELLGGARYYLEAEHRGRAPSRGVRIGVQIHNTWLNPEVVSTYLREKHQIQARAQRLPEIQMLMVSGTGNFFLTWDNVSSQPIPANATAHQIQTALEELLAVKCKLEPLSANILLRLGFEQGLEGSSSDGHLTSGIEPFCGRFSFHQPRHLVLVPPAAQKGNRLDQYTHLCLAYKGHMNTILTVTVSFTIGFQNTVKKNVTCDWSLAGASPNSWQFACTDLWKTCVHRSAQLQPPPANSPVLVHQIDLLPLSPEMDVFYVDEIIIADTNLTVSQADSGTARPGGNLLELLSVVGSPPVYSVTSWLAGCGLELPLITASSVPTGGAEEGSGLVQVTTQRLQRTSPPLGGHFRIQLSHTVIPAVPVHISASHLQKLLQTNADDFTSRYLNVSDFTVTEDLKTCYEHVWTLSWSNQVGDLPSFIRVSDENLTGINPAVTTRVVYDGGVFLGPIFGDMLVTANQYTQVVVRVNDIPAHCSGSCSFQYLEGSTPRVHSVWYALGDIDLLVYITGNSFSGDSEALQVTVNKTSCKVIFSNQTNVVCQTGLLPVGVHQISMLVRPSGLAVNASGGGLFLNVEPRLDAVEPSRAADIGGLWATIRGSSLEDVSLVLFGSQFCAINVTTSNSRRIQCKVPPKGEDGPTVNVTVIRGDHSVVLPKAFTYVSSLNPVIVSLSRNRSSIAGGETLSIGMVLPMNHTDLDAQVHIGDTRARVRAQAAQGLEVVLPPLPAGHHGISVSINGAHVHAQGVDLHIQYITEVFSIQPCCGSVLGGTILSISGRGFSRNPALVWVLVGNRSCDIVNSTETNVWCETPPAPLPPGAPAPVEVWAGSQPFPHQPLPSLVGKGFIFTYEMAATPVVTATRGEITNHSLKLYVEGQNLSNSEVLLGNLSCDVETQSPSSNTSLSGCAFPFHSLEAGIYPLQVRQRQMGFADMSAVPQQFVVLPQITAISPTLGSTCGGTVLTVRGLALNSSRRSVQVDISGPFTCVILSLGDQTVLCRITPAGNPLPGASFTLNVTVLVNGLPSACQGNCTLFLCEETTPVVDAWTTTISGSLTTVLIRGQRLGTAADEPMVFVDDRLPCTVTFFNTTHVACWISDLAPGPHYLSVFHTRYGYACSGYVYRHFHILPQVFHYFPKNFSLHGGSLLTLEGTALRGRNSTFVYIGQQACLTVNLSSELIQCAVPAGNGSVALVIEVDGLSYQVGVIGYSDAFTPELLSVSQTDDVLTFSVAGISGAANVDIFIGMFPCVGVSGNRTLLQCVVPSLPVGEYQVRGYDHLRGWASSILVFTSRVTVTAVTENFGCLGGRLVHVFGAGFSPENISAAVCGAPCQVLANATVSAFSCLVLPLDVSLAFLCGLRPEEENCETSCCSYVQCDLTVAVGTESLPESWPYFYTCEESSRCICAQDRWTESVFLSFSGLFISPKVERDEVLIYNSSCTITMETEAKMECETPNQPITAKITEIQKSWGQNTQGNFPFQFCRRWSRAHSWFPERVPQEGDNVTVEKGQLLLLDTNTSILNFLHVKGGKLIFLDPGPIELRAHSILVSDGGELRIGSEDKPFQGKAQIKLYGSSHSTPFFPYGVKFLAVRNGTLSLHGSLPEVVVTHLRAAAYARDTVLALEDAVDWHAGDEVTVISGMGAEGAKPLEETVIVETAQNTDLHLRSPLRYSHNSTENWVAGELHVLKVMVVLLSRSVTIQGNLTDERVQLLASCQRANASQGDLQNCLYFKSEKMLGSRDLGARVIIQSFPKEPSWVQLKGVQFRDLGQAFCKHVSSLTLVGALRGSYMRGCTVWRSFSRGLSMSRTLGLKVDGNVFYDILGHTLLVGTPPEMRYIPWEVIPGRENDWSEQGNIIRNNVIISVSGTEGLSSTEMMTPSGIYIRDPTNVVEGNRVCAAGYGYFFHLVTNQTSQAPLLSFTRNSAHACTRCGLFVYPKFQPAWDNGTGPTLFQNFTVWGSAGGAQIFRSSNLHLKNFQVYACRDFGIDILESDANTSVTDSLLLAHFAPKGSLCMLAGIKTPKRWELTVSNTTFVNFDLTDCVAIRTCSGCSRGQGGFTVKTNQLKFTNSPNLVAFPFPHAAILEDLDGSLSGKNRSHVLASTETLPASCLVKASFSQLVHGSVCEENVLFHRMSIGLANAPKVSYDLTITDSRNKTTTVSYVHDTLSNPYGWMALLLDQETYSLRFESPWTNSSLQYSATFENFAPGNYLLLVHTDLWPHPDILIRCGSQVGRSLPSLPSPGRDQGCDWFFHSQLRQLTYLVSGEGQVQVILQVREGVAPTISASSSAAESVLKWSLSEAWEGMEKGWGGHSGTIPGPGDDVLILPNRTVLVDTDLPSLRGLYVMGTLEFPVDRSNVLSLACMLIAGGELKVGTLENPLEKEKKLLILLRASEGVFCDRFIGIRIDPGTIGVFGKLQLHSAYPKKSWTHLGADIASGNERIIVENTVDWRPQDKIVLSSSSYEPHEAEVLTVKEVRGHHVSIHERLRHRHIGSVHVMEDGRHIRLASEVGLLTRNIQIQGDTSCGGRLLVGSFRKSSVEEFSGILQLFNVEIQNFGSPLYSSIELTDTSAGSWIISCTLHQSCGGGIRAAASQGIVLNDNVVFSTAGHGIDLEGQDYSLSNNLVVLMTQSAWSPTWVAGIKVNQAKDIHLRGNVVAGSERLGFHIRGYRCSSPEALWSDNVAHSSLHGLHLYKETGLDNCTSISGFLAFKNFDYGAMLHVEHAMEIENLTLVDNTIGLLAVVYVSYAPQCYSENLQIVVRNSVIVATSSSFDCIQDRVKPRSANVTSPDRAPSNPRGGRVGILWPVFTSEPNRWPQEPWHKVRNGHLISGIMKLQDVTFSSFVKSCYSDDLDVCILSNAEDTGIVPLITAERTRMLKIKDKNKFYFPPLQTRKDLGRLVCSESDCESPRKYLFKDLDGRALGLPPPVSVFPKIEAEWTGSFFNTGTFREEQKCTYRLLIQGYICKQTDQVILILDSADATWAMQKLYPVVSVTSGFVDTFSSVNANTPCSTSGSVSAFYSILPTKEITKVCFVDQTPQVLRFFLLGNKSTSKLLLAVFYHELQSPNVFLGERFITPTQVQSTSSLLNGSIGANYFSIMDNLLYVVLQGEEPIEIRSGVSIHLALTVMFSVLEKGWEMMTLERLTDFLQVSQDQIRFIHEMPGNEATLKAMADRRAKRKRNCPTVTCASHDRVGQRRLLMKEMSSYRVLPPTTMETISKVMVVEIGHLPAVRNTGVIPSLSSNKLQTLAHQVITAQQTGVLENVLNMTIGALLVTQSKGVIGYGNTSNFETGNLIYIRPYGLSVLVQPSDGEVGKELTVQPQLILLDKQVPCAQNRRVESLGPPSEPWVISVSLEGTSDSMLRGCTQAETQDGYVRFSNLAVLISGSNWRFIFTVTFPPGVNFTARSRLFAVLPATPSERPTIILAASLCSGVSWLALCCLVCCWFKKSKSRKIKSEEISESQTNDQKNHSHVSPKHQESQVETEKEGTMMAEDLRMKVTLGKLNQLPHQSRNGVSRRKVSRRAVQEEGGSREEAEAAVPAPGTTSVTSHGNTCALGSPAQQLYLQETGSWKESQEQVLRYQLSGQDQLLLPCPDLRRETQRLQGQSRLGKEHVSLGLPQEKPASCSAAETFCLHSVCPEAVQGQL
ncbi:fibrocystin isoform X1 [Neophocaena asiaeorientalis asiaeorientalis]|uniref:Fibrocystin n=1 Tax=Neophocaena asiaeorientalis asiaeorientalis TaxID=1706337 RepID=A0A341D6N9_NEOAA|nr:fibrocystin isoform X1 [Neophocaena asiaeorientalis asiaeorientalis]XP_024621687.1 fibrocystin isoform X1 [Neophocaena asiaeorientalis asiaeorientalis]XP_024621688.1 fibrocystin isoform X1 [Neophocaena asiaeorientalis asiaeorientalis]XP_024621689.1 fibrocystin isoform X1 [Neophocaena asiaeorientalis asiaeorientalis]XP_024621690.1 fibrocystin isoform X1 [Neophocaena asiaeorientalis asiaeorientalis]